MPTHGADPDRWTIGQLLTWTTNYLKSKGCESPRLDAEVLLASVLKYPRVQLYVCFDAIISDQARAAFRDLVKQRAAGAPVAYLVGRKEFYSLPLRVSPAVLIPRPDTETLVVEFLNLYKSKAKVRGLDIGTGSGAIALACVSQHPGAHFIATDISAEALAIARENAAQLNLAQRVDFRQGASLDPVLDEPPFDVIISNPPYIPTADIPALEPGVRDYEPRLALDGGPDGLDIVRAIIAKAEQHLTPRGSLLLEIGTAQEEPIRSLIQQHTSLVLAPTVRDAANHPRVIRAHKS